MATGYSRLTRVEERRNLKSAILFTILTILALIFVFFAGIPLLGKYTGFISDLGKSSKPIGIVDTTPPAPPHFNNFPDFTNQNKVEISGSTESGANVKISFNGKDQDVLADKDGKFVQNFDLTDGANTFSAVAVDPSGNTSQKTDEFKIVFDNKPPDLTIDSPSDGAQFFGSKQKQVTIHATTEPETEVTINDRIISVDSGGKFQYTTTLNDGENKFNIKVKDQAGNLTERDLILNFSS